VRIEDKIGKGFDKAFSEYSYAVSSLMDIKKRKPQLRAGYVPVVTVQEKT
jgi:hypothetical protein